MRPTPRLRVFFAILLALPACVLPTAALQSAQPHPAVPGVGPQVDRIARGILTQTGVPSASIAVVQHGQLVYTHAYGLARLDPSTPATSQMRYSIGSISKQFTAAAILMLQEDGKLSIDDPVGKFIPGLTQGDKVTIRQVLSHTSGYQDFWPEDYLMTPMLRPTTTQQILDTWAKKPLDFPPGTQWQYSNTNYVIAGRIVEVITGQPLFDFLEQRIFRPLGMTFVFDLNDGPLPPTDAAGYLRHALGPLRPAPQEGHRWMFAAMDLAMTAHDLALWDESLIARSLMKPASYQQMFTEVKLPNGVGTGYGLGVEIHDHQGHRSIEHSGEVSGFVADNEVWPDDGVAVAVLTNQDAVDAASFIADLIAPVAANVPLTPPEQQALNIYHQLLHGSIDRSLLAPNLNGYFTPQTIHDFQSSLTPLGEPISIRQTVEELRGGMTLRVFLLTYPTRTLELSTYTYPNGKLEQYLIAPTD